MLSMAALPLYKKRHDLRVTGATIAKHRGRTCIAQSSNHRRHRCQWSRRGRTVISGCATLVV